MGLRTRALRCFRVGLGVEAQPLPAYEHSEAQRCGERAFRRKLHKGVGKNSSRLGKKKIDVPGRVEAVDHKHVQICPPPFIAH